jgi:hypothetical protein
MQYVSIRSSSSGVPRTGCDGGGRDCLKGALIPIGGLTSDFPSRLIGERGPWGSVRTMLRNRALAVDSLDPHDGRGGAQRVERARRKSCSGPNPSFCALQRLSRKLTP